LQVDFVACAQDRRSGQLFYIDTQYRTSEDGLLEARATTTNSKAETNTQRRDAIAKAAEENEDGVGTSQAMP
jgi:hypothetical protein